ncbi:MAG: hypothetical protein OXH68_03035 [Gammaproteobacteria bacterium]|nr:hypothetical protein [Gammaproteobacteria bacterium]
MEPWAWVLVGVAVGAGVVLAATKPKALAALPEALFGALVALPLAVPIVLVVLAVMVPIALLLAVILIPVMGLVVAITVVSIIVGLLAIPIHAIAKRVSRRRAGG